MTISPKLIFCCFFVLCLANSSCSAPFSWQDFLNLTDVHPGDVDPLVHDLKFYLHHFGYLDASNNFTDTFDDDLKSALLAYQKNFNLDPTGDLDIATILQLISPRCGVADIINGTSSMAVANQSGRHLYSFFPTKPMWPSSKRVLTYAVTSASAVNVPLDVLRSVFARAFARWSAATNLNFTDVTMSSDSSEPDITIGFYGGDHGDGEPFDGVLGTLAHAFSPTDGRFHLDAAEQWVAEGNVADASSANAVDLESVAVHEIGHLLGLGHSSVEEAIMYPTIRTRTRKVELASDDVRGVQTLYGSNPSYNGGSNSPGTTSEETGMNGGGGRRGVEYGVVLAVGILISVIMVLL